MKILSAAFEKNDSCWIVIEATIEWKGTQYSGKILFELDGRDAELEGELELLHQEADDAAEAAGRPSQYFWNVIWQDPENVKKLEAECKKGYDLWEAEQA